MTRVVISFDLPDSLNEKEISSAVINLHQLPGGFIYDKYKTFGNAIPKRHMYLIDFPWTLEALDFLDFGQNPGAGVTSGFFGYLDNGPVNKWETFDVTEQTKGWVADPSSNNGIHMELPFNGCTIWTFYGSTRFPIIEQRPYLEIIIKNEETNLSKKALFQNPHLSSFTLENGFLKFNTNNIFNKNINISLFDIRGREVAMLTNRKFSSKGGGKLDISNTLSKLSTGTYICKVNIGKYNRAQKILIRN